MPFNRKKKQLAFGFLSRPWSETEKQKRALSTQARKARKEDSLLNAVEAGTEKKSCFTFVAVALSSPTRGFPSNDEIVSEEDLTNKRDFKTAREPEPRIKKNTHGS